MDLTENRHRYVTEALGVLAIVFVAGAAIIASNASPLLVAAATGVTFAGMWWLFGNRGHFNPALTIAGAATRKTSAKEVLPILLAQLVGALVGGALLYAVFDTPSVGPGRLALAASAPTLAGMGVLSVLVLEMVLTALFALVWLRLRVQPEERTSERDHHTAGLAMGAAYGGIMLGSLALTWSTLNPLRALAPAVFAGAGATAFLVLAVASIAGGLLAAGVWLALLEPTRGETRAPAPTHA